jgi:hypothetical protein
MYGELQEESHRSLSEPIPSAKRQGAGETWPLGLTAGLTTKVVKNSISESI